jgi:exopolysaccharide biosynthesis galactosyltransferase PssJ
MNHTLTFIIPVRHQDNAKDWSVLKKNLSETMRSISLQTSPNWNAVIVANQGADLPPLLPKFEVKWVDFAPNQLHEKGSCSQETFYEAFRIDKGRRVLSGMLHIKPTGHIMIVDDDDFVSNKLTSFVEQNRASNGWFIKNGYVWSEGTNYVYLYSDFSNFCGSSHVIRADLYNIPSNFSEASEEYIKRMLGSHIFIHPYLDGEGKPLAELPFIGAIYRVGHIGAHSKSKGVMSMFFFKKELVKRPKELLRRVMRLRLINRTLRNEFFNRTI